MGMSNEYDFDCNICKGFSVPTDYVCKECREKELEKARAEERDKLKRFNELLNSMELIMISCNSIRKHLRARTKNEYDWAYDLNENVGDIKTEASSWIKTYLELLNELRLEKEQKEED